MAENKEKKPAKKEKLTKKQIEELQVKADKADEYFGQLKRLMAEFDNYKKRIIREQTNAMAVASKNLILELLPIVDDLERALNAIKEGQPAQTIAKGVELTYNDIEKLLEAEGVEKINPVGEEFNPIEHEALVQVESEQDPNTIVDVVQKGYKLNNFLIRPAKVTISKG